MSHESRYSKVFVKIWHSKDFRTLSGDAKLLFVYLLTSPHRNMGGFYYLPFPYLCFDIGLDENRVAKAFQELEDRGMAVYDKDAQVVLIRKWFLYNPIENQNQAKGLNKQLAEIPKSRLFESFVNCVKEHCKYTETILKGFDISFETLSKPFRNPSETLSKPFAKPGTGTGTGTGDIYTCAPDGARVYTAPSPGGSVEAEKVTATLGDKSSKSGPRSPFKSKRQEQLFDEFWAQYPKKRSKGQAERTWVKIKPDEQLFEAIMAGLERAKTSVEWQKDGGQYIPHPSTWLNAKGWEDEYRTDGNYVRGKEKANGLYDVIDLYRLPRTGEGKNAK
ncbi:MAG: hypothetical protein QM399_01065 [Bacillota bacterium]|nr:hypothetical protein [Bacillota bacterium]